MTGNNDFHEGFDHGDQIRAGSPRAFGIVFAVVFAIIAFWPLIDDGTIRQWSLLVSGGFLLTALVFPKALQPLNKLWFRFGMLLHQIVNPIVMGFLFFVTVTPIALIMRLVGKDPLLRRFDPDT